MWRAFKLVLGIPLIFALTLVQLLLNVFGMLGAIVTTIIAFLMYFTLGMILLFQLQPVNEIAIMSLVATAFFLSPLLMAGVSSLNEHNVEIDIFIPSLMIGIEYDGSRYHKKVEKDIAKNEICCKRGIQLVHIREFDCPTINCDKKC